MSLGLSGNLCGSVYTPIFIMITEINGSKILRKRIYYASVNVNLMEENIIQIKSGVTINFGASETI